MDERRGQFRRGRIWLDATILEQTCLMCSECYLLNLKGTFWLHPLILVEYYNCSPVFVWLSVLIVPWILSSFDFFLISIFICISHGKSSFFSTSSYHRHHLGGPWPIGAWGVGAVLFLLLHLIQVGEWHISWYVLFNSIINELLIADALIIYGFRDDVYHCVADAHKSSTKNCCWNIFSHIHSVCFPVACMMMIGHLLL